MVWGTRLGGSGQRAAGSGQRSAARGKEGDCRKEVEGWVVGRWVDSFQLSARLAASRG